MSNTGTSFVAPVVHPIPTRCPDCTRPLDARGYAQENPPCDGCTFGYPHHVGVSFCTAPALPTCTTCAPPQGTTHP